MLIHATLPSQASFSGSTSVAAPVTTNTIAFQQALHDINNLLMIMSTYTALAVDKLPVDSPIYRHLRLAEETVSQAALFAHELRMALK